MTFSLFDWLVIHIRPKERIAPGGTFAGLTPEEIRQLKRMRDEVRQARDATKAFVSWNRGGLV
ncbi:MAG: hypothetical protein IPM06_05760 [Rhizobiales bacterium]|nr:hypothetical protein [Hyphomicrobiales bacterium]